jgi:DNA-binding NarL/FixJ family response regulator
MTSGPIILIDDEKDDISFLTEALTELNVRNKIVAFNSAEAALNYFETADEKPFLVICDINMPRVSGFELRKKLHARQRFWTGTFPFVFLSTGGGNAVINDAYSMTVQGYFIKPTKLDELEEMLKSIISYWTWCKHPNVREDALW